MYSIIATDGNTYGPVDMTALQEWCKEGRVTRDSNLLDSDTGATMKASDLPALAAIFGPPTMAPPGPVSGPAPSPYAQPQPGMGPAPNPYGQPPSPYFRPEMTTQPISEEDLKGFNFGAFSLTWIWGLNHKKPILLIVFAVGLIPILGAIANLGIAIWAGTNGNKWAWESGRFATPEHMKETEKVWNTWGIVLFILGILFAIAYVIMVFFLVRSGNIRTYRSY